MDFMELRIEFDREGWILQMKLTRILSAMLAILLCLGVMPLTVMAAETATIYENGADRTNDGDAVVNFSAIAPAGKEWDCYYTWSLGADAGYLINLNRVTEELNVVPNAYDAVSGTGTIRVDNASSGKHYMYIVLAERGNPSNTSNLLVIEVPAFEPLTVVPSAEGAVYDAATNTLVLEGAATVTFTTNGMGCGMEYVGTPVGPELELDGGEGYTRTATFPATPATYVIEAYLGLRTARCTVKVVEPHVHTGGTATCVARAICTVCNAPYGELAAHAYATAWSSNAEGHWHVCSVCNGKDGVSGHGSSAPATLDKAEVCAACGYEIAPKTGYTLTIVYATETENIYYETVRYETVKIDQDVSNRTLTFAPGTVVDLSDYWPETLRQQIEGHSYGFCAFRRLDGDATYRTNAYKMDRDITVKADWFFESAAHYYNTFNLDPTEGTLAYRRVREAISSETYKILLDAHIPTRDGYTFAGWSLEKNGEIINADTVFTDNCTLYANWGKIGTTFDSGSLKYIVTGEDTVAVYDAADGATKSGTRVVPSTVTHEGKTYRVTKIGANAFRGWTDLRQIHLPDSIEEIGTGAFSDCTGLVTVDLGEGVEEIKANAFMDCRALKTITFPDSLNRIYARAFKNCTALVEIRFGKGVRQIDQNVFENCSYLWTLTLPSSVGTIKEEAFVECSRLTKVDIYYKEKKPNVKENAFPEKTVVRYIEEDAEQDQPTDSTTGVSGSMNALVFVVDDRESDLTNKIIDLTPVGGTALRVGGDTVAGTAGQTAVRFADGSGLTVGAAGWTALGKVIAQGESAQLSVKASTPNTAGYSFGRANATVLAGLSVEFAAISASGAARSVSVTGGDFTYSTPLTLSAGMSTSNLAAFRLNENGTVTQKPLALAVGADGNYTANIQSDGNSEYVIVYLPEEAKPEPKPSFASLIPVYRLHFVTNGGSPIATQLRLLSNKVDLSRYVPKREGYTFAGWYADPALTVKLTAPFRMRGNRVVYAGWIENEG